MLMLDAKGSHITPAMARQIYGQIALKFGVLMEDLDLWAEMHPSQNTEWENCAITVQRLGVKDLDTEGIPRRTFAGLPLELNAHLSPTVILIRKNHEIIAEIGRLGFTDFSVAQ